LSAYSLMIRKASSERDSLGGGSSSPKVCRLVSCRYAWRTTIGCIELNQRATICRF
jgi:hypothetical protein